MTLDGLTIKDCVGDAVYVLGTDATRAEHVTVSGCTVVSCEEGILTAKADYVSIVGNHVRDTTVQDDIEPTVGSHILVAGNVLEGGTQALDVFQGVTDCIVADNVLHGGQGILVGVGGNAAIARVEVRGNNLFECTQGIKISDSAGNGTVDVMVSDNTVYDCSNGIRVDDGANPTLVTDVTFQGNRVIFDATIPSGPRAMMLNCDRGVASGNKISRGNTGTGGILIRVQGGVHNLITGNYLDGNNIAGAIAVSVNSGTTSTVIHNNVLRDCPNGVLDSGTTSVVRDNDAV